jgi:hypothetical protein
MKWVRIILVLAALTMDHPAGAADKKPNFRWVEKVTSGLIYPFSTERTLLLVET